MLEARSFPRATAPYLPTLGDAIRSLFQPAEGFYLRWTGAAVIVECGNWTGVSNADVQAQVDAAPLDTPAVRAKADADALTDVAKAAYLTLLDLVNVERARHGVAAVTPAQFITAVKNKVDVLP